MILADTATVLVLLLVVALACAAVFAIAAIVVALCNLAIIGVRELAYRRRRNRRAATLYGHERRD